MKSLAPTRKMEGNKRVTTLPSGKDEHRHYIHESRNLTGEMREKTKTLAPCEPKQRHLVMNRTAHKHQENRSMEAVHRGVKFSGVRDYCDMV